MASLEVSIIEVVPVGCLVETQDQYKMQTITPKITARTTATPTISLRLSPCETVLEVLATVEGGLSTARSDDGVTVKPGVTSPSLLSLVLLVVTSRAPCKHE